MVACGQRANGALSQWQSSGLLIRGFRVRVPDAPPFAWGDLQVAPTVAWRARAHGWVSGPGPLLTGGVPSGKRAVEATFRFGHGHRHPQRPPRRWLFSAAYPGAAG